MSQWKTMQECYQEAGGFPFEVECNDSGVVAARSKGSFTVVDMSSHWETQDGSCWTLGGYAKSPIWRLAHTTQLAALAAAVAGQLHEISKPRIVIAAPKSCSCDFVLLLQTGCTCGSIERYRGGI